MTIKDKRLPFNRQNGYHFPINLPLLLFLINDNIFAHYFAQLSVYRVRKRNNTKSEIIT